MEIEGIGLLDLPPIQNRHSKIGNPRPLGCHAQAAVCLSVSLRLSAISAVKLRPKRPKAIQPQRSQRDAEGLSDPARAPQSKIGIPKSAIHNPSGATPKRRFA